MSGSSLPLKADFDAIKALEMWKNGHKGRAVRIDHDDGYGAAAWEVTLYRGSRSVYLVEPVEDDDWVGLARTIQLAIEKANAEGL